MRYSFVYQFFTFISVFQHLNRCSHLTDVLVSPLMCTLTFWTVVKTSEINVHYLLHIPISNLLWFFSNFSLFPEILLWRAFSKLQINVKAVCVFVASEYQTGPGEEAVGGEPGELQETVRPTQVEGKLQYLRSYSKLRFYKKYHWFML